MIRTHRSRLCVAAALLGVAAMAGCSSPDPDTTSRSVTASKSSAAAEPSAAPDFPTATPSVRPAETSTPDPTVVRTPPPKQFQKTRVRVESPARARLVGLDVDRSGGVERVTFTFADTKVLPTYDVQFVESVRAHPEDDPIAVNGNAFLDVGFSFTNPNTKGRLGVQPGMRPNQPIVKETLLVQNLGGSLRFAVGLDHRAQFRAVELKDPTRLVVEVRP